MVVAGWARRRTVGFAGAVIVAPRQSWQFGSLRTRKVAAMAILDPKEWPQVTFGECQLGDRRRTKRLVKVAEQAALQPDGSTSEPTESWGDCKAAYRLFDQEGVTFGEIIAPHCQQTRAVCREGGRPTRERNVRQDEAYPQEVAAGSLSQSDRIK